MAKRRETVGRSRRRREGRTGGEPGPSASSAGPAVEPPTAETIDDVWSRAGFKYRTRAIVLLVINILLFAGLGCFAYWLRTGVVFAPAEADYAAQFKATFSPSFESDVTLGSLLTFPISVEQVPMQIVILGLLLAALVSIPILVSILYRFQASLPFLAVVAFLAMMPWLAITLIGSCILASVRRFRFQFRYASALL
ncbi:MAG: hypothetical protein GY778_23980, partial [bacterium]|nr:hypothetical protein [bacterium]